MNLYGFFYSGCIYESAAALISLHRTKRGAWQAMRAAMLKAAAEERDFCIQHGGRRMMRDKPLEHVSFHVWAVEVLP